MPCVVYFRAALHLELHLLHLRRLKHYFSLPRENNLLKMFEFFNITICWLNRHYTLPKK